MIELALPQHDIGVREVAAFSARASYVLMCLTLCWGVFTATGWVRRLTGHQAIRNGHMMLAVLTLATGSTHAGVFLLLREQGLSLTGIAVPFSGLLRHSFGILGLELMIAITLTVALKRWVNYRRWLRFHQLAYVAVAMIVVHSWFGAIANGHLAVLWLGGVTVLVPAATLTVLRLLPPRWLIRAGLLGAAPAAVPAQRSQQSAIVPPVTVNGTGGPVRVIVDNQRCKRYGICQAESPDLFQLMEDGRLRYIRDPDAGERAGAQAAAMACPMRAIELREVSHR
ncbi:MAG TPA: ferredoxin [Actinophytocola sp.]|uniref:4Fe-4S domain-containing protein n=1 Tax=Actinophytocola sp. TaxID=1872138 RepID=UPI002DDDB5E2|nr:ferredoxin [Actinophytocola sp.]HEV2779172.1 ferredoxin [Actinophytocola sp.]